MTKTKSTKRALLLSALALLVCVSMLIGSTFAWFTDSVTSSGNIIKSGTLEVTMEWKDATTNGKVQSYTDASQGAIFNYDKWEPGYVEAKNIKITNAGTLALKYQLNIIANGEVSALAKVIDVYFAEGDITLADRTMTELRKIGTLAEVLAGMPANVSGDLLENESDKVTIALKMQEDAGNEYQGLAIGSDFSVQLLATQLTSEFDSFDDQYDKGAWHPDFTVTSVEDLAAALANGGKIQVNGTLNAGATQDVPNWTNAPAEFIFDATTLDALKGGKYVLEQGSRYGVVSLISAGESLALSDMEITANSQWPVYLSNYGGTLTLEDIDVTATQGAGIYPYGTNGTTTIKSANVNQKALSDEFASSTPWAGTAVATSNGHNLIIEDGTYIGSTWGVYVYNSGANVTINGGTFKAPKVIQADGVWSTGGNKSVVTVNDGNFDGALHLDWGTTPPEIYINGGNFTNFSATVYGAAKLVIKGGTFDADPSAYVADGYDAVELADGSYVVINRKADEVKVLGLTLIPDGNNSKIIVNDKEGFLNLTKLFANWTKLFADGGTTVTEYANVSGADYYYAGRWTVSLEADIDLNNATIAPVIFDHPVSTGTLTFDGNDHTIKNAKIVTDATTQNAAGLFNFVYNTAVRDLKLDNIHVTGSNVGNSTAGVLAGGCNAGIDNITITNSSVTGGKYTGGVVGYGYTDVLNCTLTNVTVKGGYKLGGLIGYICASSGTSDVTGNTLTDCTVDGIGGGVYAGGKTEYVIGKLVGNYNCDGTCNNNTITNMTTSATDNIGKIEAGKTVTQ
ncbi:MAG: SipW-dependent-type signal peptide-containing protein [Clostridia bacterium]|nr:SipW-dependent-type signal peptide-containing protein [Clostridia bacterium]